MAEVRQFFEGVRQLAAEAAVSADPRLIVAAMEVLRMATATIRRLQHQLTRRWRPAA